MEKCLIIRTTNLVELREFETGDLYPVLRDTLDIFDMIQLGDKASLWIKDEGMIDGSPFNPLATFVLAMGNTPHRMSATPIYGTAIVAGGTTHDGDTEGLNDEAIRALTFVLRTNVVPAL